MQDNNEKTYKILESERRWFVSVPKVLAQGVGMKPGDKIKWIVERGELIIKKVWNMDELYITTRIIIDILAGIGIGVLFFCV